MMRSLFSGVAGLRTHQTRMDVIGNNIANVNTVGFKSSNVTFQELMYQTTQNASGANEDTGRGGINAKQIGLGVSTAAINTTVATEGASQSTGNPFDIQISGDSFFIVNSGQQNYFTRAGAFYVDGVGNLAMTSNGFNVMGWQPDPDRPDLIKKDTVSPLRIMSAANMTAEPEATTAGYLSGIIDKNSTQLTSDSGLISNIAFYDSLGYSYVAKFSVSSKDGTDALPEGVFKLTLTDIIDSATNKSIVDTDAGETVGTYMNLSGNESVYIHYDTKTGKYLGWDTSKTQTDPGNAESTLDLTTTGAKDSFSTIGMRLDESVMYDNNETSTFAGTAGDYNGNHAGRKVGTMSGVSVQTDGKIYAAYDNGTTRLLGQIAVTSFANPSGLEKVGDNLYSATMNSGLFDGIGKDVTSDGVGKMTTGVLEMSNVDLSAEFTDMITTQRGFQANSRIITVSDSMIEELTNLKR
ncbi:MAG: flagellar hook-basal body complex protein [Lachnospiraceae bacterium]|nr:flagellar hook-basal body complex protein [Lachnospiraceae bacterium]